ncbi:MAG: hypothetical protein PHG23_02215 [Candidatus Pacebacteria bacterium]|nr:hypothetical protein [Candidatus Paceibacterota bacterium]
MLAAKGFTGGGSEIYAISDTNWHYFAGTFNGTDWKAYVDGNNPVIKNSPATLNISLNNLFIGSRSRDTSFWSGSIDDVRIYEKAVPVSQVHQNYFSGLNRLFANQNIPKQEYKNRLAELTGAFAEK